MALCVFGFSTLNKGIHAADVVLERRNPSALGFFPSLLRCSDRFSKFYCYGQMKLTVNSWCSVTQARVIISKSRAVGLSQGQHQKAHCRLVEQFTSGVVDIGRKSCKGTGCWLAYLRVTPVLGHWGVYLLGWWTRHAANGHGTRGMQVGADSGRLAGRAITHHRQPATETCKNHPRKSQQHRKS
ncbi:hypothetical protein TcasGA2_TC000950 [Tribolium castaneum]|uniref:Uncharacterized protein n=1 Tax=Tribolium castaneum TaxID=7070 RepID=D6W981_TRICA|nr:hypothetical protein TcasGA2_TC000950 [Tribolium castaneum]